MNTATPPCHLAPINLHSPADFAEIHRQRQICGWDHDLPKLESWKRKQDEGLKRFYWLCIPDPTAAAAPATPSTEASEEKKVVYAGHISLDAYSDPADEELARADRAVLTIQTLFILPAYRGLGLGSRAMDLVEALAATTETQCRWLALTTLSERHYLDESPEGTGVWARTGAEPPVMGCNQWWYARRGYVLWKEEPRWREVGVAGDEVVFYAAFMRKELAGLRGGVVVSE
ncbi:hypothetical protein ASPACDRAFT_44790 [Aspergillus aculeatus ATCC 16872]|uniref:N-acetyltransferase domain-containing protein n=1 Tax=Aspergillus aculeatus (strain ATCC 16872 / CBS 172.66 / WB 5094) TaxID=690307 RepID=A0A1L9WQ17_ASPA1|nr:uncharacterized protein ASPACDRAFT_44790 [Aspergillus aculeatus ATCC 16872]OJJ98285.1 hypothetical protein ASPACDRAFT_44790 [Aspergillus aculeatus ATCC 16872]